MIVAGAVADDLMHLGLDLLPLPLCAHVRGINLIVKWPILHTTAVDLRARSMGAVQTL